jgi:hypothetical protein
MRSAGKTLYAFNVEQQCDLLKLFYLAQAQGGLDSEAVQVYGMFARDIFFR